MTLTDVFWVRQIKEKVSFNDLNLYTHSLSDAFVDVSLLGQNLTVENAELLEPQDTAGDVSTQGAVPKAWIKRDGHFILLKDGGKRDVQAELLASRVARCFDAEQVLYEPYEYNGVSVSASRLITSVERSIVPMEYAEIYAANHDTTLKAMISEYDQYHPLMDLNKSFLGYENIEGARCLTTDTPMNQLDAAMIGVRSVGLNQISEVKREWFDDRSEWEMFSRRLGVLKKL